MQRIIQIEGMSCGRCANDVAAQLRALGGVYHVSVDFAAQTATIDMTGEVDDAALQNAVEQSGYAVASIR